MTQIKDVLLRQPVDILQTEPKVIKLKHWKLFSKTPSLCIVVSGEGFISLQLTGPPLHTHYSIWPWRESTVLPVATSLLSRVAASSRNK